MENNRITAEFMQPSFNGFGLYDFDGGHYKLDELKFHSSWDWLIPTIEKCRERQFYGSQRLIQNIDNRLLKLDLLATYGNVVDFITHYNLQNS